MLLRLDAADRLVRAVEERGALPVAEVARVLLAVAGGPASSPQPCHRVLPDARATAEILLRLIHLAAERGASSVGDLCALSRPRSRPQPP